jgi:hypothetical protein
MPGVYCVGRGEGKENLNKCRLFHKWLVDNGVSVDQT